MDPGYSDKLARAARAFPRSDKPHHLLGVVKNEQGLAHLNGRVQVKELVHESRVRLATWNIRSLTGKLREIGEVMVRRKIGILCLQETKWVEEKAKEVELYGHKL